MKIDILTLFPGMYEAFINESIIKRAIEKGKVDINVHNIRDYSDDKNKKVDDTPYGGGAGMVLKCQPVFDAIKALKNDKTKVILMTPQGVVHNQKLAQTLSKDEHLILVCGHYEGFDERIRTIVDMEISIGDYVLTGGELPSMVVTDSIVRLVEGVIDEESHQRDSFNDNLLDHPVYTKPRNFNGLEVPEVLLSGHHENIEKWRQTERIIRTMERRPDLIKPNANYLIIKDNNTKELTYFEYEKLDGFDFMPKNDAKRDDVINVTKMMIVKPSLIEKMMKKKVERKMQYFVERATTLLTEEDDEEDTQVLLTEMERYRRIMINNYLKYLGADFINFITQKLMIIFNQLRMRKNITIEQNEYENKGKAR